MHASFSSSAPWRGYDDTIPNLKIGKDTRVIFQGFTGKQATANAKESIAWGTKIVGGVRPGKTGEHLGLPVLPTVRKAMEELKPDVTGIYVAAHQAVGAIEEAIEAEVPLIVAVAEHIPLHDILRVAMSRLYKMLSAYWIAGAFDTQNAVKVPLGRRKRSRYHLGDRPLPDRLPTSSLLHAR